MQDASFRGVAKDSIPAGAVVTGSTGGYQTPDGYAVSCVPGQPQCYYFRAGVGAHRRPTGDRRRHHRVGLRREGAQRARDRPRRHGRRRVGRLAGHVARLPAHRGIRTVRHRGRAPARLGRQVESGRLGYYGYDGARLAYRFPEGGADGDRLRRPRTRARGVALPVTTMSLNPLGDFQPPMRQLLAGAALEWQDRIADARFDYEREVDRDTKNFVSERVALSATVRPWLGWSLTGGADYDLARDFWGSADLTLRQAQPTCGTSLGVRRYAPYFDLWSIWGVFSPVPYTAVNGAVWATPVKGLSLRAGGERYWYANAAGGDSARRRADAGLALERRRPATPSVRRSASTRATTWSSAPAPRSAASRGASSCSPGRMLTFTVQGGHMVRPLEYRVEEPALNWFGLAAEYRRHRNGCASESGRRASTRIASALMPSSIDWSQTRIALTISWLFGTQHRQSPTAARRTAGGTAMRSHPPLLRRRAGALARRLRRRARARGRRTASTTRSTASSSRSARGATSAIVKAGQSVFPSPAVCANCHDGYGAAPRGLDAPPPPRASNLHYTHPDHVRWSGRPLVGDSALPCGTCHIPTGARVDDRAPADTRPVLRLPPDPRAAPLRARHRLRHLPLHARAGRHAHRGEDREVPRAAVAPRLHAGALAAGTRPPGARAARRSCAVCHARDFCMQCHVNAPGDQARSSRSLRIPARWPSSAELRPPASHQDERFASRHGGWRNRISAAAPSATRRRAASPATAFHRRSCCDCRRPGRAAASAHGSIARPRRRTSPTLPTATTRSRAPARRSAAPAMPAPSAWHATVPAPPPWAATTRSAS